MFGQHQQFCYLKLVSCTAYPMNKFAKKLQPPVHMVHFTVLGINTNTINQGGAITVSLHISIRIFYSWSRVTASLRMSTIGILYSWSKATQIPMRTAASYHCEIVVFIIMGIQKVEATPLHFPWFITGVAIKWSFQGSPFIWVIFLRNIWLRIIYQPPLIWFIFILAAFTRLFKPDNIQQKRCTVMIEIQFTVETPMFCGLSIKWNMKRAQYKAQEVIIFIPTPRKFHRYLEPAFLMAYPLRNPMTFSQKSSDYSSKFTPLHKNYPLNFVSRWKQRLNDIWKPYLNSGFKTFE